MNHDNRAKDENNTLAYEQNFARVESVDGSRVALGYDLDPALWPWLALPPQHPVLIEKYQYFSSVTAGWATDRFSPNTYSALTRFSWHCPEATGAGDYGTRGLCINRATADGEVMDIDIYTAADEHLVHMECDGFAFEDRDFKTWRAQSRRKALDQGKAADIDYVAPERAGLGPNGKSLISDLQETAGQTTVLALVTSANGFYPSHPFHTGSGDHVNVGHYFDCVMQMAHLLTGASEPLQCVGGESSFTRFIELDVPFEIRLITHEPSDAAKIELSFQLSQLGKENAHINLHLQNSKK